MFSWRLPNSASAPDGHELLHFRTVEAIEHGGDDVPIAAKRVVARSVEVGRPDGDVGASVLLPVRPRHGQACQFGHGIGLVSRFQGTKQQRVFPNRLQGRPRVYARVSKEDQLINVGPVRGLDDIPCTSQVVPDEIRAPCHVGANAAYGSSAEQDRVELRVAAWSRKSSASRSHVMSSQPVLQTPRPSAEPSIPPPATQIRRPVRLNWPMSQVLLQEGVAYQHYK